LRRFLLISFRDCLICKTAIFLNRFVNCITKKPIAQLSNEEVLWRAVYHRRQIKDSGELKPGFFRDKSGLSCDWSAYTTIRRARLGFGKPPRPKYSGLVEICVASIRDVSVASDVAHKPIPIDDRWNYAHCQLTIPLTSAQSIALIKKSQFCVKPDLNLLLQSNEN
jgi:hypothetical protein